MDVSLPVFDVKIVNPLLHLISIKGHMKESTGEKRSPTAE